MARATADAPPQRRAPLLRRLAGGRKRLSGHARMLAQPAYERLLAAEGFLRRLIPVLILIFLAIVAATRFVQLTEMRGERDRQATQRLTMSAELIAGALRAAEPTLPTDGYGMAIQNALDQAVSDDVFGFSMAYVTDTEGLVLATAPLGLAPVGAELATIIGQSEPMILYSATVPVTLTDERDALAAGRPLVGRLGGLVLVQPQDVVHAAWRSNVSLDVSVFVGTSAILLVILYGYFAQSARANEADRIYAGTHERLDTALLRGRCGLWDWDLASGRMFWSKSMFDILGMPQRDALMGFGEVNRLVHPEDGDLMAIAEYLFETGETTVDRMFRMAHVNGSWIWMRARAELVGQETGEPHLIGIAVDTSEQIRIAERTKTADIRLRDSIETISEAFVLWDADNRLVMCNTKYQQLHALPDAAVQRGTPYAEVIAAGRQPIVRAQIPSEGRPEEGSRSVEAQLEDGRWLQINERRTKDGGFVSVGTDITPIKRHEEKLIEGERRLMATIADLRQSRQKLELQAQQMVELAEKYDSERASAVDANLAKSEFLANISHEIRTPLNAVIGFSEIMQSGMFGPLGSPKYLEYCNDINDSGRYLLGVINDVLDMSRIEAGRLQVDLEELPFDDLVDESIRIVTAQAATRDIAVATEVESGLRLEGDRRSIKQIMLNLLSNAVKFTPIGGRITVRARRVGGAITFSVRDTGIGIPRDAIAKLGQPFVQVQNQFTKSHKGSGLGLAITRSLAELHGGAMRIRSSEGRGTTVAVRLPVHRPPTEPPVVA